MILMYSGGSRKTKDELQSWYNNWCVQYMIRATAMRTFVILYLLHNWQDTASVPLNIVHFFSFYVYVILTIIYMIHIKINFKLLTNLYKIIKSPKIKIKQLTFIWTSKTGSSTKFDALEYHPGSSSYAKQNKNGKNDNN